ncbi:hypothetical protein [Citricoccus sp.]|uniref:hypothetical protein n=1 Tax=Citricoccus sp. TaxID=1978372 RepID=UPI0028BD26A6|nr:hypothetical protein [Citricoccus sp.]
MPVPCGRLQMQMGMRDPLLQHETVYSGRHNVRVAVGDKDWGFDVCQTIEVASISGEFEDGSEL